MFFIDFRSFLTSYENVLKSLIPNEIRKSGHNFSSPIYITLFIKYLKNISFSQHISKVFNNFPKCPLFLYLFWHCH